MIMRGRRRHFKTLVGTFEPTRQIRLERITLPELDKRNTVDYHDALVFDGDCRYNMICSQYFCRKLGIVVNFKDNAITWVDSKVMMTPTSMVNDCTSVLFAALDRADEEILDDYENMLDCYASKRILYAKYEKSNIPFVCKQQKYL